MASARSLGTLTAEDFRHHLGTRFRLTGALPESPCRVSCEVELADVTDYAAGPPGTFRTPFSVIFHGPPEPVLPQGVYRLEQERFGALELFIVPLGPNEPAEPGEAPATMRYEAVFG